MDGEVTLDHVSHSSQDNDSDASQYGRGFHACQYFSPEDLHRLENLAGGQSPGDALPLDGAATLRGRLESFKPPWCSRNVAAFGLLASQMPASMTTATRIWTANALLYFDLCGGDRNCGKEALGRRLGMSPNTAMKLVRELLAAGLIATVPRDRGSHSYVTTPLARKIISIVIALTKPAPAGRAAGKAPRKTAPKAKPRAVFRPADELANPGAQSPTVVTIPDPAMDPSAAGLTPSGMVNLTPSGDEDLTPTPVYKVEKAENKVNKGAAGGDEKLLSSAAWKAWIGAGLARGWGWKRKQIPAVKECIAAGYSCLEDLGLGIARYVRRYPRGIPQLSLLLVMQREEEDLRKRQHEASGAHSAAVAVTQTAATLSAMDDCGDRQTGRQRMADLKAMMASLPTKNGPRGAVSAAAVGRSVSREVVIAHHHVSAHEAHLVGDLANVDPHPSIPGTPEVEVPHRQAVERAVDLERVNPEKGGASIGGLDGSGGNIGANDDPQDENRETVLVRVDGDVLIPERPAAHGVSVVPVVHGEKIDVVPLRHERPLSDILADFRRRVADGPQRVHERGHYHILICGSRVPDIGPQSLVPRLRQLDCERNAFFLHTWATALDGHKGQIQHHR